MPNWCENRLEVTGDTKQLLKLKKDAVLKYKKAEKGEPKQNAFSIGKLYPLPKELKNTTSPNTVVADDVYKIELAKAKLANEKNEITMGLPITQKMSDNLKKKYGTDNWYDWQVRHWGTKWDTRTYADSYSKGKLNYDFDTAWSPPINAIEYISTKYPKLTFKLKYCEGGVCFSGDFWVKNGKILMDNQINDVWEEYQSQGD